MLEVVLHTDGGKLVFNGHTHEQFTDLFQLVNDQTEPLQGQDRPGQRPPQRHDSDPEVGWGPDAAELSGTYGTWPPGKLDVKPLPSAHYLDIGTLVTTARELNFATAGSLKVDVETVVLELAGVAAPPS